jgi:ABC-type glycerol-3-phosphate transport system permease component
VSQETDAKLAVPAMVTIAVLQFIFVWDDLLVGLLFLQSPDVRPITSGWPRSRPCICSTCHS